MKGIYPQKWVIREYGVSFAGGETKSVPLLHYIKRVAYIDTPMITGSQLIGGRDYWMKLSTLLNDNSQIGEKVSLYKNLTQIMKGEPLVEKDDIRNPKLSYKRDDGKIFDLKGLCHRNKVIFYFATAVEKWFSPKRHIAYY